MTIKPLSKGWRFRLWRILHPIRHRRYKKIFKHLDEMHEYKSARLLSVLREGVVK